MRKYHIQQKTIKNTAQLMQKLKAIIKGNIVHDVGYRVMLTNPGSAQKAGIDIWIEIPGGGKKMIAKYPSITLPSGLDYKKYPWMIIILPTIPVGSYSWHAILKNTTSGNIISESISPWTFSKTVSAEAGNSMEMDTIMHGVPEIDFEK